MKYQAHRGVQKEFPENTMPAYQAAVNQGYDIIECDPQITRDGVVVMLHDDTINRTGRNQDGSLIEGEIRIDEITYQEALRYDFGISFSNAFKGIKIPTLKELIDFSIANHIRLKVDNKYEYFTPENKQKFFDVFPRDIANITFNVIHLETAKYIAKRFPNVTIGFDGVAEEEKLKEIKKIIGNHDLEIWMPLECEITSWWQGDFINEKRAETVKKYGKLCGWLIDNEKDYQKILRYDVYAIETTGFIKPAK